MIIKKTGAFKTSDGELFGTEAGAIAHEQELNNFKAEKTYTLDHMRNCLAKALQQAGKLWGVIITENRKEFLTEYSVETASMTLCYEEYYNKRFFDVRGDVDESALIDFATEMANYLMGQLVCVTCGSTHVRPLENNRRPGAHLELCNACYWHKAATIYFERWTLEQNGQTTATEKFNDH